MVERVKCRDMVLLFEGVAGSSKTYTDICYTIMLAEKYPGSRHLWLRKTRKSMNQSVLQLLEEEILPPGHYLARGKNRNYRDEYVFENGSVIGLGGMDHADKFLSSKWDTITCFEAIEFEEKDAISLLRCFRSGSIVRPTLDPETGETKPRQWFQLTFETNPRNAGHWLNVWGLQGRAKRIATTHKDNPAYWDEQRQDWTDAGRHYRDNVLAQMTGPQRLWYLDGRWANAEGLVYDTFQASVHVVKPFTIPKDWVRYRAIDFGYNNPFVCQWWAEDPDGNLYLYREIYHSKRIVADHAKTINTLSEGEAYRFTVADHDAEDRATLASCGIQTVSAKKAVTPGLEAVRNRLRVQANGKPRLFILEDATHEIDGDLERAKRPTSTLAEFDAYVWDRTREGKTDKEEPLKVNDHGCFVAGTPVHTETGIRPIESVRKGERVHTPMGLCRVLDAGCTNPDAEVWEVRTDRGSLVGTADHPILTARGWVALRDITESDLLSRVTSFALEMGDSADPHTSRSDAARSFSVVCQEPFATTARVLAVPSPLPKRAAVFNLTVDGAGCYFAGGVLVSNCDAMRYLVMAVDKRAEFYVTDLDAIGEPEPVGYKTVPTALSKFLHMDDDD
jgi:phage terminase large subunit